MMCIRCGLRGRLVHSKQELLDPERKCMHRRTPATCPQLREVLSAAHRTLDLLEWQAKRNEAFAGVDRDEFDVP